MEVRSVRLDEIRLIKEDTPNPWTRYTGRSDSMLALDSDKIWQICRIVKEGSIWTTTYANMGSFTAQWSLRTTYFPAVGAQYAAYQQGMGANFCSDTITANGGVSMQLAWTGNNAADGAITIESSVDGVCWCVYPGGDYTIPLTAGCKPFDLPASAMPFFRVCYTKGSNTAGLLDIAYSTSGTSKIWAVK